MLLRRPRLRLLALVASTVSTGGGCAQIAGLTDHEPYPPNGVIEVAAGSTHACALTRAGKVWCWGANDTNQLGHRTADGGTCTTACPAGEVEGVSGAVQIAAGNGYTCALLGSGQVSCWGGDGSGELGRPAATTCGMVPCDSVPHAIVGVAGAVQISAGGHYACARTGTGAVLCWGDNTYGQLGTGDFTAPSAPRAVKGVDAIDVSAALSGANTCAATSAGAVLCWGLNAHGGTGHAPGTGDTNASDGRPCSPSPIAVKGIAGAHGISTGAYAACATVASGEITCWGYDGLGSLGNASTPAPLQLPPAAVTVVPHLASMSLRFSHACGVDAAAHAWCWGQSGVGAVGPEHQAPTTCDQTIACQPKAQDTGLGSVTAVATGTALSVALRGDGSVWAWGENDDGRLGHPPKTLGDGLCIANAKAICNATPTMVPGLPH